jgi:hypothetical protein
MTLVVSVRRVGLKPALPAPGWEYGRNGQS